MRTKFVWLTLVILLLSPLAGTALPIGPDSPVSLGDRPDGWWLNYHRDENRNGVDDVIDQFYLDGMDVKVDAYFVYSDSVDENDIASIEEIGGTVVYASENIDVAYVEAMKVGKLDEYAELEDLVLIEKVEPMYFMMNVAPQAITARESTEYSPYTAWELGYKGDGLNVAIMDSGVNDQIPVGHTMVDDMDDSELTYDPKLIAGCEALTGVAVGGAGVNPEASDSGHGTHVAGSAVGTGTDHQGIAPESRLIDIHVGALTNLNMAAVLSSIDWAVNNNETDWENDGKPNNGVPVIGMSFGGATGNGQDTMSQAVNDAVTKGVVCVVAAGNSGPNNNGLSTPGCADRSINVASFNDQNTITRNDDGISSFSSRGPRADDGDSDPYDEMKPNVAAPGSNIISAASWSKVLLAGSSGTSMATPQVAGLVALMLQANPDLRPQSPDFEMPLKTLLQTTAQRRGSPNRPSLSEKWNREWGYGAVDSYGAVKRSEDLTQTAFNGPDTVETATEDVQFSLNLPLTRTPHTIEDDETYFKVRIPSTWGRPTNIQLTSDGTVDYATRVTGPTLTGNEWLFTGTFTHTEDIDIYEEQMLRVRFRSDAPSVLSDTDYQFRVSGKQNDVRIWPAIHNVTVEAVPNLIYHDHTIDDDDSGLSSGNSDGEPNPGESIEMPVQVRNIGTKNALGVTGTISTTDSYVDITDNNEVFGNVPAGTVVESIGEFDFTIDSDCPVGHIITFNLSLADVSAHTWADSFEVTVMGTEHDLQLANLTGPSQTVVDKVAKFEANVTNLGLEEESDVRVRLYANGDQVNSTNIGSLDSEEVELVELGWTPDETGVYTINMTVDAVDGEDALSNNHMEIEVDVIVPGVNILIDDIHGRTDGYDMLISYLEDLDNVVTNASDVMGGEFDLDTLMDHDILITVESGDPEGTHHTNDEIVAIRSFVKVGGSIMVIGDADLDEYQRLTDPFDIGWSDTEGKFDDTTDQFGDHPIVNDIGHLYFESPGGSLVTDGRAESVVWDSDGDTVQVAAATIGVGRVVVIVDDNCLDDNYLDSADNRMFARKAVRWLSHAWAGDHELALVLLEHEDLIGGEDEIEVSARLMNLGNNTEEDITVKLLINDTVEDTTIISSLASGASTDVDLTWTTDGKSGQRRVSLMVEEISGETTADNNYENGSFELFNISGSVLIDRSHSGYYDYDLLVEHLEDYGLDFETSSGELSYEQLMDHDLFIVAHPDYEFSTEERQAIRDFVKGGGGLLQMNSYEGVNVLELVDFEFKDGGSTNGSTSELGDHPITQNLEEVSTYWPWANLEMDDGTIIFRDPEDERTLAGVDTYMAGRIAAISDHGMLADASINDSENLRFSRQLFNWLVQPATDVDAVLVNVTTPMYSAKDQTITVPAGVHNVGNDDLSDLEVYLWVDGDLKSTRQISSLDAGDLEYVSLSWTPTSEGNYDLEVEVTSSTGEEELDNNLEAFTHQTVEIRLHEDAEGTGNLTGTDMWHISERRERSPDHSWYFGDEVEGNYEDGNAHSGMLSSDNVSLKFLKNPVLSFRHWLELEAGDRASIMITSGDESVSYVVGNTANAWDSYQISLDAYEGENITIDFEFRADGDDDMAEGWYIDDVYIVGNLNLTPLMEFIDPVNGSTVSREHDVIAHARDVDGITNVEFRVDAGNWTAMDQQGDDDRDSKWTLMWDTTETEDGEHELTVRSTNSTGYQREDIIYVTADNTPPQVQINAPDDSVETPSVSGMVEINATILDNETTVVSADYMIGPNGTWESMSMTTGTTQSGTWEAKWDSSDVEDGRYNITVRGIDEEDNIGYDNVTVRVDNTDPTVYILEPEDEDEVNGTVDIDANVNDAGGVEEVEYQIDNGTRVSMTLDGGNQTNGTWTGQWDSTQEDDGWHNITVYGADDQDNEGSDRIQVYVNNIDNDPEVQIRTPDNETVHGGDVDILAKVTDDEQVANVEYRIDDGAWTPMAKQGVSDNYAATWDSTGAEDGWRDITVRGTDNNAHAATDMITIRVDNTEPNITSIEPVNGTMVGSSVEITTEVDDNSSVEVDYRIDTGSWMNMTEVNGSWSADWDSTDVSDGEHSLEIRAEDEVGNVGMRNVTVEVDNTWPELEVVDPMDDETVNGTIGINATVDDDNLESVDYRIDDGSWMNMSVNDTDATAILDTTTYEDGWYEISVRATDAAGNTNYSAVDVEFDNEDNPPELAIDMPGDDTLHSGQIDISVTATDDKAVDTVEYRVTNGDSTPWWEMNLTGDDVYEATWMSEGDGDVTIEIKVTDDKGQSVEDSVDIELDNTAPEVEIDEPAEGELFSDIIEISATVEDDHLDSVQAELGTYDVVDMDHEGGDTWTYEWNTSEIEYDDTSISVVAIDTLGNEATVIVNVTIDNEDPVLNEEFPEEDDLLIGDVLLKVDVDEPNPDEVEFMINDGSWEDMTQNGSDADIWEADWDSTEVDDGEHIITFRATDELGNWASITVEFTTDNTDEEPVVHITDPDDGEVVGGEFRIGADGEDDNGIETMEFRVGSSSWIEMELYTGTDTDGRWRYFWNSTETSDGNKTLEVRAYDGTQWVTVSSYMVLDNSAPKIKLNAPKDGSSVDGIKTIKITVNEDNLFNVRARLPGSGWHDMDLDVGSGKHTISWDTELVSDGTYTMTFVANDTIGNMAIHNSSFVVDNDNEKPSISITDPISGGTVVGFFDVYANVTDDRGIDTVEVRLGTGDYQEMDLDSGTVYTYNLNSIYIDDGVQTLTVRATDTDGESTTKSISIEVDNEPEPVYEVELEQKSSEVDRETKAGQSLSYRVTVANTGNVESVIRVDVEVPDDWEIDTDSEDLTIESEQETSFSFEVTVPKNAKGDHEIYVTAYPSEAGSSESVEVQYNVTVKEKKSEDKGDDIPMEMIGGGILVLIILLAAVMMMKGKGKGPAPQAQQPAAAPPAPMATAPAAPPAEPAPAAPPAQPGPSNMDGFTLNTNTE